MQIFVFAQKSMIIITLKPVLFKIFFFKSILDFAILSDFKMRTVFIWHLTILTAGKMFSKTEDQTVHFTSWQLGSFDVHVLMLYSLLSLAEGGRM